MKLAAGRNRLEPGIVDQLTIDGHGEVRPELLAEAWEALVERPHHGADAARRDPNVQLAFTKRTKGSRYLHEAIHESPPSPS